MRDYCDRTNHIADSIVRTQAEKLIFTAYVFPSSLYF
uniref:Uncharacterized protein n=1 Tax=mine drainage metagenome TaxID=410659 RepID=E6QNK9_9ZZZZ